MCQISMPTRVRISAASDAYCNAGGKPS